MASVFPIHLVIPAVILFASIARAQEVDPAKSEANAKVVVNGQVFNGIGSGVKGVAVKLEQVDASGTTTLIGDTTTNDMGDFAIRSEKSWTGKGRVSFSMASYLPESREVELSADETPFVDLQLRGNLKVRGKVADALDNKPIVGATIRLMTIFGERESKSGQDGTFEVGELDPGPIRILVEAEGFAHEKVEEENIIDVGVLEIRLQPERRVTLRVEDEGRAPIPTTTVEALVGQGQDYRMGVTDDSGVLLLRGLSMKDTVVQIRLDHPDYVRDVDFARTLELPAEQAQSSHTVTLQAAGSAGGAVLSSETGKPISGARVGAGPVWSDRMPQAWTDEEGEFQIGQLTAGPLALTVHIAGYAPDLQVVDIKPGELTSLQFKLDAAAEIRGQVVDAESKPVPRATVFAERWRDHSTLGIRTLTDDEGNFLLADVPRDEFFLGVTARGYQRLSAQSASAGSTPLKLILATAASAPGSAGSQPTELLKVGDPAPAFEVKTLDGQSLSLQSLKGKTVVLDFWATWCAPCVAEIPNLQKIFEKYGQRPDFILVGLTLEDDLNKVKRFAIDRKMNWPLAVGQDGGAMTAATAYGVLAIPAVFVIDPQGKLAAVGVIPSELPDILAKAQAK